MINLLRSLYRHYHQIAVVVSLAVATGLCLALLAVRLVHTRTWGYVGLGWNLFLAWLPMLGALAAYNLYKRHSRPSWLVTAACASFWLLFFPNAPYLVTNILHLHPAAVMPFWYDLMLVNAFAWTGLFLGLVSLYLMQALVQRTAGRLASWLFVLVVSGLTGFGIYLGRFLRWNSWDLLLSPYPVLFDVAVRLRHPIAYHQAFLFSALFSVFFATAYMMLVAAMQLQREPNRS